MGERAIQRSARIGAIVSDSGAGKQALLLQFAARRRSEGLRIAGIVEIAAPDQASECGALDVLDLATGARIPISQDLGPGSTACNLDPGGVAMACAAVQRAIERRRRPRRAEQVRQTGGRTWRIVRRLRGGRRRRDASTDHAQAA